MAKHLKEWRHKELGIISDLISQYKTIGIGDLYNFPSALLHKLRKNTPKIHFKVTNRNILKMALEKIGQKDLIEKLPDQPILILSNDNAFEIYSSIKKNKSKSKAKVGMLSPIDIVVPEGDTGLAPGPALSDLKKVGIKAQVKGATIHVTKDTVIAKEGDVINEDIVSTLSKLDIKPVELILEVVFIKEDGIIYSKDVLDVDAETIYNNFITAVRQSINLGVEISYATELTIEPMIMMAELKAKALEKEVEEKSN
ncbi:50S ribosomal protein L10 [archaeon]|nr:50S ribosomal protein L10 [archaeon]NCP79602.1 50S ribosomal protein L10 [archaeon]NCP98327.1 50S ribosomal protein L10 [archaeon]NCQ07369.1 50S ribosomal protein L10 [archaeon]NCQ51165.1 50S ribosomal protein L10 [archaeon]